VGKTCLLTRIQSRSFPEYTSATIGCAFCPHTILLPSGKAVELHLWDTAGQEKYRSFTRQYFRGSAAAVVAFDLTSSASFEGAKHWVEELKHVRAQASGAVDTCVVRKRSLEAFRSPVPRCLPSPQELPEVDLVVALAGCKVDLCPERRQVTANESRTLAAEHSMTFFEVSALDGTNVDPLFRAVAARIDHARNHRLSARGLQLGLGDGLSGNRHRCAC